MLPISADPQSDTTVCSLPFMAVDCHHGVHRPCCVNKHAQWESYKTLDEYWNGDLLSALRQNLVQGIKDPSCEHCWHMEKLGRTSLRQAVLLSRPWSPQLTLDPVVRQVKLVTGNTCNLACMMCFDTVSTTYRDLWRSDVTWIMPEQKRNLRVYDHDMDSYIRQHAAELEYIEVLGGEPLFNKTFLELVQHLVDIGQSKNITLFVITNGTLCTHAMIKLFQQFKKTVFTVSLDGVGLVNEYQRWPSRWEVIEKTLAVIDDNFDMSIMPTVTALNIIRLPDLVDYCASHHYTINNINPVQIWTDLMPSNLPQCLATQVSEPYRPFLQGPSAPDRLLSFIRRWDQQRGINICDYMPEWSGCYS